ncbi:RHS repeat-associated core domain-containing protein [Pseudomonas faucium]|uniref:RHS repeat-associated core domain-containing protein n=1 Tax=Pseudomonas faucium TaxID=2740518 RepID=UPI0039C3BA3E
MPPHKNPSFSRHRQPSSYLPYGYQNTEIKPLGLLAFNGEPFLASMECYALGNGHRIFKPGLMRFISADALSPFHEGGINCYAYCLNDPVNAQDPSGKFTIRNAATAILAVNRFKKLLHPKVKAASQWKTLANHHIENLENEVQHANELIADNHAFITFVKGPKSLYRVGNSQLKHKFVLTRDKKFFIGSFSGEGPSHASIAELGRSATGASNDVISAGYISKDGEAFSLDNQSGHFMPSVQQLTPAKNHLENLGIAVKSLRRAKFENGYVATF